MNKCALIPSHEPPIDRKQKRAKLNTTLNPDVLADARIAANAAKTLYSGNPKTMEALKAFLFEHEGHPLVFGENCESEIADWEELEKDTP